MLVNAEGNLDEQKAKRAFRDRLGLGQAGRRSDAGFTAVKKSFVGTSLSVMRDIAVAALKGELAKHGFLPPG